MAIINLKKIKERLSQPLEKTKDGKKSAEKAGGGEKEKARALPEYTIRTMQDDLAEVGLKKLEKEAKKPKIEEKIITGPSPTFEEEEEKKEKEEKKSQKAPLPSAEELVSPIPKNLPISPPAPASEPAPEFSKPKEISEKTKKKISKRSIFIIIGAILIIGIGGFFYWQQVLKPTPEPEPEPEAPDKPVLSNSLMLVEETKIISTSYELSLLNLLIQESKLEQSLGGFKRIGILNPLDDEQNFLSLSELFQKLEISIPPYSLMELENKYTLVLYSQNEEKRLGLITQVKNSENLKEQLKFWEQTMVNDLQNFFLGKNLLSPATSGFQDNNYKEIAIRYINFPEPDLTIDYAVFNNLFVLTTSRESMYKIIDRIVDNL